MNRDSIIEKILSIGSSKEAAIEYLDFIYSCDESSYQERHHILPRSIFPEFSNLKEFPWNCRGYPRVSRR